MSDLVPAFGMVVAPLVLDSPLPDVAAAPEPPFANGSVTFGCVFGVATVPLLEPPPVLESPPVLVPVPVVEPVPVVGSVPEPVPVVGTVVEPVPVVGTVVDPLPVVGAVVVAVGGVVPQELQPPVVPGDSVLDTGGEPVSVMLPASGTVHGSVPVPVHVDELEPAVQLPVGVVAVPDDGAELAPVVSAGGDT